MRRWRIESSLSSLSGYLLIHSKQSGVNINWFQKVKIDKHFISLYDRELLSTSYGKMTLPKYIINELENLPQVEK